MRLEINRNENLSTYERTQRNCHPVVQCPPKNDSGMVDFWPQDRPKNQPITSMRGTAFQNWPKPFITRPC